MILLDTSGLFSFHHADEATHKAAKSLFKEKGKKLTHSYVLSELVTLAQARGIPRKSLIAFVRDLLEHPQVEVVWVDEALHREGMQLLEIRPDKMYSLCDSVSFVLMKRRKMMEALTTDRHFTQEGFVRLL